MDVDGAEHGHGQELGREDLSIGHHHETVGRELPDRGGEGGAADARRLEERDPPVAGESRHRRRSHGSVPPCRAVGLTDDRDDPEFGISREPLERRNGEVGCAEENDTEAPS